MRTLIFKCGCRSNRSIMMQRAFKMSRFENMIHVNFFFSLHYDSSTLIRIRWQQSNLDSVEAWSVHRTPVTICVIRIIMKFKLNLAYENRANNSNGWKSIIWSKSLRNCLERLKQMKTKYEIFFPHFFLSAQMSWNLFSKNHRWVKKKAYSPAFDEIKCTLNPMHLHKLFSAFSLNLRIADC